MTGIHAIGRSPNRTMDFWRRSVGCDADGSRRSMGGGRDPAGVINEVRQSLRHWESTTVKGERKTLRSITRRLAATSPGRET